MEKIKNALLVAWGALCVIYGIALAAIVACPSCALVVIIVLAALWLL